MAVSDLITLSALLDEAKCFELVRQHRWPNGVRCPGCDSTLVIRNGHDERQPQRQRYCCKACGGRFDDLSGTVLAGHHPDTEIARAEAVVEGNVDEARDERREDVKVDEGAG